MLRSTYYVKVYKNKFVAKHIETQTVTEAYGQFTGNRILIGNFDIAAKTLETLTKASWFQPNPIIIIHSIDMSEGGLSQVEERALLELAMDVGARRAVVWQRHELSDNEVLEQARLKLNGHRR